MKRWFPWFVVGIAAVVVLWSLRPEKEAGFQLKQFGELPVLLNGRIQPLDSVARNTLLQLRRRQSVRLDEGSNGKKKLSAIEWLAEVMMKPEVADTRPVFRIDHHEVLDLLKLPEGEKYYSFNDLQGERTNFQSQVGSILEYEQKHNVDPKTRNAFQKNLLDLWGAQYLYLKLKNSLQPHDSKDFEKELAQFREVLGPGVAAVRAREAGETFDEAALGKLVGFLTQYDNMAKNSHPLMIPPSDPQNQPKGWSNVGNSLMSASDAAIHGQAQVGEIKIPPAVGFYAAMASAYRQDRKADFNQALTGYSQLLEQGLQDEARKGRMEFFLNSFQPFYKAMVIQVLAFLFCCGFWFNWSEALRRSGVYLIWLAFIIHTFGLVFRMVLEGRPPVTNLYSSAIFIGWAAVLFGGVLEQIFKNGIGGVTASAIGFATLVIAHNLASSGDTMEMMRAVLDTNFWLATHVVTVTLGYAATFVAGFLALQYVVLGFLTPNLSGARRRVLTRMIYGIICFATLFSFVGTVLGGIWADQSWGRFWGWDPKENGALLIVLWNAIFLHVRWGKLLPERLMMALPIFGNIITGFSWFGVNMLGVGLHSYGFMDKASIVLGIFYVANLIFIVPALLPERFWRSFRTCTPGSAEPRRSGPAGLKERTA